MIINKSCTFQLPFTGQKQKKIPDAAKNQLTTVHALLIFYFHEQFSTDCAYLCCSTRTHPQNISGGHKKQRLTNAVNRVEAFRNLPRQSESGIPRGLFLLRTSSAETWLLCAQEKAVDPQNKGAMSQFLGGKAPPGRCSTSKLPSDELFLMGHGRPS